MVHPKTLDEMSEFEKKAWNEHKEKWEQEHGFMSIKDQQIVAERERLSRPNNPLIK